MKICKVCSRKGDDIVVFNIKFKAVPICDDCADSIMLQQAQDYSERRKDSKLLS